MPGREEAALTPERLIVDVARLDAGGEQYRGETAPELLDIESSELLQPVGGMLYDLRIEIVGNQLLARGAVSQRVVCLCSRCAISFETKVSDTDFFYIGEILPDKEFLDLTIEVREAIILALPEYPLCDTECLGLCAVCGKNLNLLPCACSKQAVDGRWSALDGLT